MLPTFRDPTLFVRALTHRSYLNEHADADADNERLEFLGDAVLDFVTGALVYDRYPEMAEGHLTRLRSNLVRTEQLAGLARRFGLGPQLRMGKGEIETGGRERDSLLCDAFEAVIGALYLDAGLEAVRAFVEPLFIALADDIVRADHDQDAKSYLQEVAQAEFHITPSYHFVQAVGPDHERIFTVEARLEQRVIGVGQGRSKSLATQAAARDALKAFDARHLLITGASGYLGLHLLHGTRRWRVTGTYFSHPVTVPHAPTAPLDLTDRDAVFNFIQAQRPTAIIHTACSNRGDLRHIVRAATHLAEAATTFGIRLVHLSTDLVFDGEHPPYDDDSPMHPVMDYGKYKAEAEAIVRERCPQAALVRPSLIWGLTPPDHQTQWLVDGARNGTALTLFTDEIRCPIYVHDLCEALLELASKTELAGPFNVVGHQALSRWEFGQRLLHALKIPLTANIAPGSSRASGLVRARNLTLTAGRAQVELHTELRGVDEVLEKLSWHKA